MYVLYFWTFAKSESDVLPRKYIGSIHGLYDDVVTFKIDFYLKARAWEEAVFGQAKGLFKDHPVRSVMDSDLNWSSFIEKYKNLERDDGFWFSDEEVKF